MDYLRYAWYCLVFIFMLPFRLLWNISLFVAECPGIPVKSLVVSLKTVFGFLSDVVLKPVTDLASKVLMWRPLSGLQTGPASLDLGFGACLCELILSSVLIMAMAAKVAGRAIDESLHPWTKRALEGGLVVLLLFHMVIVCTSVH
jgi:hypothetical protein